MGQTSDVATDKLVALLCDALHDELIMKGLVAAQTSRSYAETRMCNRIEQAMMLAHVPLAAQIKILGQDYWRDRS